VGTGPALRAQTIYFRIIPSITLPDVLIAITGAHHEGIGRRWQRRCGQSTTSGRQLRRSRNLENPLEKWTALTECRALASEAIPPLRPVCGASLIAAIIARSRCRK